MSMERVPITVEGFKQLEAELQRLKAEERPRIIQAISVVARSQIASAGRRGSARGVMT